MLVANSRGFANPLRRLYPPYSKSSAKSVPDASSEVPRYDVNLEGWQPRNRAMAQEMVKLSMVERLWVVWDICTNQITSNDTGLG